MPDRTELPKHIVKFLQEPWEAVLSTLHPSEYPHQTVMWFVLWEGEVVLTCLKDSVKIRNLLQNPKASVLFVGPGCYASVSGSIRIEDDPEKTQQYLEVVVSRYVKPERRSKLLEFFTDPRRITITLTPDKYHSFAVKRWLKEQS